MLLLPRVDHRGTVAGCMREVEHGLVASPRAMTREGAAKGLPGIAEVGCYRREEQFDVSRDHFSVLSLASHGRRAIVGRRE
jgi:hypothetical protein